MKFAVCDDEAFERDKIRDLITQYATTKAMNIDVDYYETGEELLATYEKGKYNIIFLDVEIGADDGIVIGERIRNFPDHDVTIIYVTNYPEYMQHSFDVRAAQFFSKPLKYEIFETKMNKIFEYMRVEEDKKLIINCNGAIIVLSLSDICTIESVKSSKRNSEILITTLKEQIQTKGKLKEYTDKYGDALVYAHRSVLVNTQNIYKWMSQNIEMRNGRSVPVSRNRMQELKNIFTNDILRSVGR